MTRIGPKIEQFTPSRDDGMKWARFMGNEIGHDLGAHSARVILTNTLLLCAVEEGGWCDCPEHREAVCKTFRQMWRKPYD